MGRSSYVVYDRFLSLISSLFNNSLPVFVAAMISRASSSIIALTSTHLAVLIWVTFGYAFFCAQVMGIVVATKLNPSYISFHYFMHVCSECTGFAWKEYVVLIMLKWLFINKNVAVAAGAWALLVFCAFLGVYFFNAILALYFSHLGQTTYSNLRKFNTDAFALAIAFSWTLVVASEMYPAHKSHDLAGTDDVLEDPEDALKDDSGGYYFLAYAIFITVAMVVVQWKVGWIVDRQDLIDAEEEEGLDTRPSSQYRPVTFVDSPYNREDSYWTSVDSMDPDTNDVILTGGSNPMNVNNGNYNSPLNIVARQSESMGDARPSIMRESIIRPTHSTTDSRSVFSDLNLCWSYVDNIIFAWDPRGRCKQSIVHLLNTVSGYIVGCAWYTFSLMTFQKYFVAIPAGQLLGLFIYSFLMTLLVVVIMVYVEGNNNKQLEEKLKDFRTNNMLTQDVLEKVAARYKRNNELAMVAGRLLCGWSWSDFVTSCFTNLLSDRERELTKYKSSNWVGALTKTIVAIIIVIAGKYLDEYLTKRRFKKATNAETSHTHANAHASSSSEDRKTDSFSNVTRAGSGSRASGAVINGKLLANIPIDSDNVGVGSSKTGGRRLTSSLLENGGAGGDSDVEDEVVI